MKLTSKRRGRIFIVSAPSGCGKTTLCRKLVKATKGLVRSVSVTTRPKRNGEIQGRDYYFVSRPEFQRRIRQNDFLEWTRTYGWYYGTPKKFVDYFLEQGRDILLSIDVKGAMRVKKLYPHSVLIYILPPSLEELKKRLKRRNSDNKREIEKRLKITKRELVFADRYDYVVINDSVAKAVGELKAIVLAQRCRVLGKENR